MQRSIEGAGYLQHGCLRVGAKSGCLPNVATSSVKPFDWYNRESLLPQLSTSWQERISSMSVGGRITYLELLDIQEESVAILRRPGATINDEIAKGYLKLIHKPGITIASVYL